ncbi:MAG: hypothetical protein GXW99_03065 [Clostridiales bacterium]|nr:hypothetical protein [Clostridiales bacterium]
MMITDSFEGQPFFKMRQLKMGKLGENPTQVRCRYSRITMIHIPLRSPKVMVFGSTCPLTFGIFTEGFLLPKSAGRGHRHE